MKYGKYLSTISNPIPYKRMKQAIHNSDSFMQLLGCAVNNVYDDQDLENNYLGLVKICKKYKKKNNTNPNVFIHLRGKVLKHRWYVANEQRLRYINEKYDKYLVREIRDNMKVKKWGEFIFK
jgi:hypothetical protein